MTRTTIHPLTPTGRVRCAYVEITRHELGPVTYSLFQVTDGGTYCETLTCAKALSLLGIEVGS